MAWKKAVGGLGLLTAALAVVAICFFRQTSLDALLPVLRSARLGWVVAGLLCMVGSVVLEAGNSRSILAALGHRVPFRHCLRYSCLGFCGASITPSSSGGQPLQIWAMKRDGVPVSHGSLTMLLLAVCYQTALLAWGGVGCAVLGGVPAWGSGTGWLLLLGASVNLALTVGMIGVMFLPGPARWLTMEGIRLLARFHLLRDENGVKERAERGLRSYAAGAECIRRHPALLFRGFCLAAAQVCAVAMVPWMVCLAFGAEASPVAVMATQMVLTLASAAFPVPGAVGAAEGGFLALFRPVLGEALAAPAMLLSRSVSFYLFLPLCAVASFSL